MKAVAKLAGAAAGLWAASEAYAKFTEKSLRDEVILITGGAGGIGKLMAEMAAREGAAVAIADISPGVHAVAEQLVKEGLRVKSYQFNITDMDAVNENCEKVASDFGGRVDVLINNAGVVSGKTLLENTPRAMNLTMQVNTISHFWTVRKLLPGMLERDHGRVVTIASAAGTVGTAGLADYCASTCVCDRR
jgi:all-trans-retinol dehydrogenase (NAD+)